MKKKGHKWAQNGPTSQIVVVQEDSNHQKSNATVEQVVGWSLDAQPPRLAFINFLQLALK